MKLSKLRSAAIELALPAALVIAYQVWSTRVANPFFPPIGQIWNAFQVLWLNTDGLDQIAASLGNLARGYFGGVGLGLAVGLLLSRIRWLMIATAPILSFALTLPPVALLPLFIIAFGIGPALQGGIIFWGVFFTIAVHTMAGLRDIDPTVQDMLRSFRITGLRRIGLVLLPSAGQQISGAACASLSVALMAMVISELIGASRGIGVVILVSQQSFRYAEMWSGMVLLAILGYLLNWAYLQIERPLLHRLGSEARP